MNWLTTALASSIGKKVVMAVTGLLLCGFLITHLAGNLLLYVSPKAYNDYARNLHDQAALLLVAEIGLLALFLIHLYLAVRTWRENNAARRTRYAIRASKIEDQTATIRPDTWMFISGTIVLGFVLLHLFDFRFHLRPDIDYDSFHGDGWLRTLSVLKSPLSAIVYLIGSVLLGLHLGHGVQSAFQTLGLNHPKYNGLIRGASRVFAGIIAVGFASFVIWAQFTDPPTLADKAPAVEKAVTTESPKN